MFPSHILKNVLKVLLCVIIFINISGISGAIVADRDVIIAFNQKPGNSEKLLISSHGGTVKKVFHLIPAISVRIPESKIESIKNDPRVKYIEEERTYKVADEYSNSWGVQHIGTQTVHNQSIYGDGVKIAVLDTGIDRNHPDLVDNYKGGISFVDYTTDPMDDSGHGTHVSGIIAAKNNGFGVIGVAPNSSIYAVKVLAPAGGITSWIISGIQWAVDNNMSIATMSFNCVPNLLFPCDDPALRDAINSSYNSGLLLVASGGNTNGGEVLYPAAYESVIAVTATDQNDMQASFSPIGPKIELAAPGVNVWSTVPIGNQTRCIYCDPSGYKLLGGTSMAAPHVTGVAALIFSSGFKDVNRDGKNDNKDVREILQNTAKDLGVSGRDNVYGYGLVDAAKAVLGVEPGPEPEPIKLTIVRTKGPETKDAKNASLSEGNYSIEIHNINLSRLVMTVYDNGIKRNNLSSVYKFNKSNNITVNMSVGVGSVFKVVFTPYGDKNTIGYVTIRRI